MSNSSHRFGFPYSISLPTLTLCPPQVISLHVRHLPTGTVLLRGPPSICASPKPSTELGAHWAPDTNWWKKRWHGGGKEAVDQRPERHRPGHTLPPRAVQDPACMPGPLTPGPPPRWQLIGLLFHSPILTLNVMNLFLNSNKEQENTCQSPSSRPSVVTLNPEAALTWRPPHWGEDAHPQSQSHSHTFPRVGL